MKPSARSLIGTLILIFGLILYALLIMQLGAALAFSSIILQTIFYLVAGVVWLWPARRLLRWMGDK